MNSNHRNIDELLAASRPCPPAPPADEFSRIHQQILASSKKRTNHRLMTIAAGLIIAIAISSFKGDVAQEINSSNLDAELYMIENIENFFMQTVDNLQQENSIEQWASLLE